MNGFPFGQTLTFTPQSADGYGTRTAGSPVSVDGCVVYGTPGSEVVGSQDTTTSDVNILAPPGMSVSPTDRVTTEDGEIYEVTSPPIDWVSPFTGLTPGVQFTARRVVG